jgi:hypothetical protein
MGDLLYYLAVGRLVRDSSGQFKENSHQLIAAQSNNESNTESQKNYRTHVTAIMNKGAAKLVSGKRIRLTPDQQNYDLHVLPDALEDDNSRLIVFFAITDSEFDKHQSITNLFRDFRQSFHDKFPAAEIEQAKQSGNIHKQSQSLFNSLFSQYNSSKLRDAQGKVEQVKDAMKTNVQKALDNMEQLEDMEVKSEAFEEQARQFSKGATDVKRMMRCRYIKITILLAVIVAVILAIIIYVAYSQSKK